MGGHPNGLAVNFRKGPTTARIKGIKIATRKTLELFMEEPLTHESIETFLENLGLNAQNAGISPELLLGHSLKSYLVIKRMITSEIITIPQEDLGSIAIEYIDEIEPVGQYFDIEQLLEEINERYAETETTAIESEF